MPVTPPVAAVRVCSGGRCGGEREKGKGVAAERCGGGRERGKGVAAECCGGERKRGKGVAAENQRSPPEHRRPLEPHPLPPFLPPHPCPTHSCLCPVLHMAASPPTPPSLPPTPHSSCRGRGEAGQRVVLCWRGALLAGFSAGGVLCWRGSLLAGFSAGGVLC
ncbi:unnamed protein product [Closterium sp. Naga37s-1]|nr:unnamed protein product [Closterium sp. Naga37s-1]